MLLLVLVFYAWWFNYPGSSISLGMGLSVTLKAGVKLPGWLWGAIAQWSEHLQLKQKLRPGFNSQQLPWVLSLPADLLMLMRWRICGALILLGCYQHRYMNGKIYGVLVQFSCYQHRWKRLWCSSTVQLLSTQTFYKWICKAPSISG